MKKIMLLALVSSMALAGCQSGGGRAPVGAGPAAPASVYRLTNEEVQRARAIHSKAVQTGKVYTPGELPGATQYLNAVVNRVSAQRPPGAVPLQAFIVKDDGVNAFTTGAGYLYFNRGLLARLQNEAQLAMIVGHEAAHVDAGHIARGATDEATVSVLTELGSAVLQGYGGIAGTIGQIGVGLAGQRASAYFSQGHELEADDIGLAYVLRAGYDGVQAASVFRVLSMANGPRGRLAEFFSSHPNSEGRLQTLAAKAAATGQRGGYVGDAAYLSQMMAALNRTGR